MRVVSNASLGDMFNFTMGAREIRNPQKLSYLPPIRRETKVKLKGVSFNPQVSI